MPSSSGSSATGANGVFVPPGQAQAASSYGQLFQPMYDQALAGVQGMGQTPAAQAWPQVQSTVNQITNSPYAPGAIQGAGQGLGIYNQYLNPSAIAGAGQLQGLGNIAAGQAPGIAQAGQSILNTAFDPQQDLYNRTQHRTLDTQNAINAMSGVASTPYGAGVTGTAMRNFDIDWQNQQLARQNTGIQGAGSAVAGLQGLGGLETTGYGGANTLYGNAATGANTYGSMPYNTAQGINSNSLSGLQNLVNLGNANYQLPQTLIGDIQSYLGLGQNASQLQNTIGNTNFQQQAAGMQGLGQIGGALIKPISSIMPSS